VGLLDPSYKKEGEEKMNRFSIERAAEAQVASCGGARNVRCSCVSKSERSERRRRTMKRIWIAAAAAAFLVFPAGAQKVTTEQSGPKQIVRLHTALNHWTVVEVGDPVTSVVAGSAAFVVELHGNRVLVQPTEPDVSTNLFIWTASGRLNFELEPAGTVEQMDFAVDDPPTDPPKAQAARAPEAPRAQSAMELLLSGRPVKFEQTKRGKHKIEVMFRDVIPDGDRVYLRYAIRNDGTRPYAGRTPVVFAVNVEELPGDAAKLASSQLSDQQAAHLETSGQEIPVEVVAGRMQADRLEPGQETQGIIAVKLPPSTGPRVLRFYFPADARSKVSATLVL
jgi:hypothetical protein